MQVISGPWRGCQETVEYRTDHREGGYAAKVLDRAERYLEWELT